MIGSGAVTASAINAELYRPEGNRLDLSDEFVRDFARAERPSPNTIIKFSEFRNNTYSVIGVGERTSAGVRQRGYSNLTGSAFGTASRTTIRAGSGLSIYTQFFTGQGTTFLVVEVDGNVARNEFTFLKQAFNIPLYTADAPVHGFAVFTQGKTAWRWQVNTGELIVNQEYRYIFG